MSREIKFRAFTGLEMVYDVMCGKFGAFYVNPTNNGLDENDAASLSNFNTKYDADIPIMQFTGLHDKNGTEIYEGDILARTTIEDAIVIERHGAFVAQKISNNKNILLSEYCDAFTNIIGNIHSNPELLNQ